MAKKTKTGGVAAQNLIDSLLGSDPATKATARAKSEKPDDSSTFVLSATDQNISHLSLQGAKKDDDTVSIVAATRVAPTQVGKAENKAESAKRFQLQTESRDVTSSREEIDRDAPTSIRAKPELPLFKQNVVGVGGAYSSTEAVLKQSEALRVAQTRINDLESELERVRREAERLHSAGETLRRRYEEMLSKLEGFSLEKEEKQKIYEEEKKVLRSQISAKEREVDDLRQRNEEMDSRLEANFKKVRVRERELEHRLEILKMENSSLVATKDKMILELKRQLDQLSQENEYAQQRSHEVYSQFKDKQETVRRVVRALRIALTILEGEDTANSVKKAE